MKVQVDNVWATPSGLHMRVTVWNDAQTWRHKYDTMVPVAEIPAEAVSALWTTLVEDTFREDLEDVPLF